MKPRHPAWAVAACALVLANLAYFAWNRGALAGLGLQPPRLAETEPHRLDQQVRPELLQILENEPVEPAAPPTGPSPASEDGIAAPLAEPVIPTDRSAR